MLLYIYALQEQVKKKTALILENEHQLMQADKLKALTGLVNGFAHELNTPIGNAIMLASMINETPSIKNCSISPDQEGCQDIQTAIKHLSHNLDKTTRLIEHFKEVSIDIQGRAKMNFGLRKTMINTCKAMQIKSSDIDFTYSIDIDDRLSIYGIPQLYESIFEQLVSNSLTHSFRNDHPHHIHISAGLLNDHVVIDYQDNGLPLSIPFEKACEPFYTSIRTQGHHGLGMNILYNTVQVMGGQIKYLHQSQGMHYTFDFPNA